MSSGRKHVYYGVVGSLLLSFVYFSILTISNSFEHAITQFIEMWYFLVILIAGFGVQIGLYSYTRAHFHSKNVAATGSVAAAGGVSGTSMVLCCLHHLTDVLPVIGFSAAALFLSEYQVFFILIGIFSNFVGITMMLSVMQRHDAVPSGNSWKKLFSYNMHSVRNRTALLSVIVLVIFGLFLAYQPLTQGAATINPTGTEQEQNAIPDSLSLGSEVNSENGVTIEITPVDFSFGEPLVFDVRFTTHSGDLGFEVDEISFLADDKGNEYLPTGWEGSPPGGHHRSGKLLFPSIPEETKSFQLIMENIYDVPERTFFWSLE